MLTEEQQKLVEENFNLARFKSNKWVEKLNGKLSKEEIMSACCYGLTKASKYFDSSKGYKFASFACKIMDNEVLMELRSSKKRDKDIVFSSFYTTNPASNEEYQLEDFVDGLSDNYVDKQVDNNLNIKELNYLLDKLKPFHKELVIRQFVMNQTQKEIANKIGISQSYVSRIIKKAIERMRKYAS